MALALGGCSEGYSTREGVLILKHDMGQERALEALNKLGHQQLSDFHWHYRMLPGCVNEVHAVDPADFLVSLVSRTDPTMVAPVLDRMDEVDASQVMWLLRYLPRFCAATQETRR